MIAEIMIENVEKRVEENCEFKENMNDIWEMLEKSLINMIILFFLSYFNVIWESFK